MNTMSKHQTSSELEAFDEVHSLPIEKNGSFSFDEALIGIDDFDLKDLSEWMDDKYREDVDVDITSDLLNEFFPSSEPEDKYLNLDSLPAFASSTNQLPISQVTTKEENISPNQNIPMRKHPRGSIKTNKSKAKRRRKLNTKRKTKTSTRPKSQPRSEQITCTSDTTNASKPRSAITHITTEPLRTTTKFDQIVHASPVTTHKELAVPTPQYQRHYSDALSKLASSMRRTEMSRAEILRQRKRLSTSSPHSTPSSKMNNASSSSCSEFSSKNQTTIDSSMGTSAMLHSPYEYSTMSTTPAYGQVKNLPHSARNMNTHNVLPSHLSPSERRTIDRLTNFLGMRGESLTIGSEQSLLQLKEYIRKVNNPV